MPVKRRRPRLNTTVSTPTKQILRELSPDYGGEGRLIDLLVYDFKKIRDKQKRGL